MQKKGLVALAAVATLGVALPAAAQSLNAAYVGASIGQSKFSADCAGTSTCDKNDTAWRIFGGYQFNQFIAAEVGYVDLGKLSFSGTLLGTPFNGKIESTAFDLSAVGSYHFTPEISVLGRIGGYASKTKTSGTNVISEDKSGTGLTFGLGAGYDFTKNLGARIEWQRYSSVKAGTAGDSDVDFFNIGVLWRFQ